MRCGESIVAETTVLADGAGVTTSLTDDLGLPECPLALETADREGDGMEEVEDEIDETADEPQVTILTEGAEIDSRVEEINMVGGWGGGMKRYHRYELTLPVPARMSFTC